MQPAAAAKMSGSDWTAAVIDPVTGERSDSYGEFIRIEPAENGLSCKVTGLTSAKTVVIVNVDGAQYESLVTVK